MDNQKESQTDDTVLDAYPMPDSSVSPTALADLDCPRQDLLPLSADRACDLLEDVTVYAALPAGELEMPLTVEKIRQYPPDTVFAVPKREWEKGADFRTAVNARMDRQDEREDAFLRHTGDCFAIYQFQPRTDTGGQPHMTLEAARTQGLSPRCASYGLVYTAPLPEGVGLEELHTRFTGRLLRDYLFREIKPCDIIVVRENGVLTPW
ncbi:MAG: hypothetical protein IJT94_07430, partial [Oscillibacter sp.]|nr:hypothetical protein [Oscillibacter sp.]